MADLKSVMQDEIKRLAKKEVKAMVLPLEKRIKELTGIVRETKKELETLHKTADKLKTLTPQKKKLTVSKDQLDKSRLTGKMILKMRKKLGLSRADFGKLIGSSAHAVYLWESDRAKPRTESRARIIAVRGMGKREIDERLGAGAEKKEVAPKK